MRSWQDDRVHELQTTVRDMIAHYVNAPRGDHYLRWAGTLVGFGSAFLSVEQRQGLLRDIEQARTDADIRARGAVLSDMLAAALTTTGGGVDDADVLPPEVGPEAPAGGDPR